MAIKNVIVPDNLGITIKASHLTPSKFDIQIDGVTLKANAAGEISVDVSSLGTTIVSADAGQLLTAGTDGGALITNEVIEDAIGDMVVSATDGLTYNDAIGALTAAISSAIGASSTSTVVSVTDTGNGALSITATVTVDPTVGNLLTTEAGGLRVDTSAVYAAIAPLTTNDILVTSGTGVAHTVNGVAASTPIVEVQDAFGVHLGEMFT